MNKYYQLQFKIEYKSNDCLDVTLNLRLTSKFMKLYEITNKGAHN